MHPKGSSPEHQHNLSLEIKKSLTEEERRDLELILIELKSLAASFTSPGETTIKQIYGRLIDEQQSKVPNETLIGQLKNELLGAYMPYYNKLLYSLKVKFPEHLLLAFQKRNIDLPNMASKMLEDITELMRKPLPRESKDNPFRLSAWLDTLQNSILIIQRLLSGK